MKKLTLTLAIITCAIGIDAQSTDLKQAIKHYNSKNYGLAEKEIDRAIKSSFSSTHEISTAMNYYFLIHTDIYSSKEALPNNLERLGKISDAYRICKKNDSEGLYMEALTQRINEIGAMLLQIADSHYREGRNTEYFFAMDYFTHFMEMIDVECGQHYVELSTTATALGFEQLAVKYWYKMIEAKYNTEYAYKELISMLYNLGKYDRVDGLLIKAKADFPESTSFSEVEILRFMDKDMKFSALQLAKKTVEKDPNNSDVTFLLGLLNTQHNEHDDALDSFLKVAHMKTDHFETHFELGKYFYRFSNKEGHLDLAKQYLEKAYSLKPQDSLTRTLLHDVYLESGDVQSAVSLSLTSGR